jgi:SAM-dependent methyltransferase
VTPRDGGGTGQLGDDPVARGELGFGRLAQAYDVLRPVDANWLEVLDAMWEDGALAGTRVLEVGCGTGRLAAALVERGARVWGVDPSPEMLAEARAALGRRVGLKAGRAEALPFRDAWFDRVVMRLAVHLVDRPSAFAEAARVLRPGGRIVIATFADDHFDRIWLARFFPSLAAIDRARFPSEEEIRSELGSAGFAPVRVRRLSQTGTVRRDDALARLRGRYISTLSILPEEEYAAGLAHAERELREETAYGLEWLVVTADAP